jgi:hypothetical protein
MTAPTEPGKCAGPDICRDNMGGFNQGRPQNQASTGCAMDVGNSTGNFAGGGDLGRTIKVTGWIDSALG